MGRSRSSSGVSSPLLSPTNMGINSEGYHPDPEVGDVVPAMAKEKPKKRLRSLDAMRGMTVRASRPPACSFSVTFVWTWCATCTDERALCSCAPTLLAFKILLTNSFSLAFVLLSPY